MQWNTGGKIEHIKTKYGAISFQHNIVVSKLYCSQWINEAVEKSSFNDLSRAFCFTH